ncbi:MAG: archaeal heat shock protein Hsp14 [Thermoprotei archaeon]
MMRGRGVLSMLMREAGEYSRAFYEVVLPAIDIYELGGELVVEMDLAGFTKDNISVKTTAHTLTVTAKREAPKDDVDGVYLRQRPLRIHRVIRLPVDVDESVEPTAKYENGVLTVKLSMKGAKKVRIE